MFRNHFWKVNKYLSNSILYLPIQQTSNYQFEIQSCVTHAVKIWPFGKSLRNWLLAKTPSENVCLRKRRKRICYYVCVCVSVVVYVCVSVFMCVCMCVCVCVSNREVEKMCPLFLFLFASNIHNSNILLCLNMTSNSDRPLVLTFAVFLIYIQFEENTVFLFIK
jgi:hypothetical protein